jgi:hypothetical protein
MSVAFNNTHYSKFNSRPAVRIVLMAKSLTVRKLIGTLCLKIDRVSTSFDEAVPSAMPAALKVTFIY